MRPRDFAALSGTAFDVVVIGGGIHGLATALDAAARGLSVALVEAGDFAAATSFNHQRTAHGGLRSLQTGDLRKFRLSIRERRTFARIAPHLVEPLAFLLPTTRKLTRSRPAIGAAFLLDAAFGADRNRDLPSRLQLPRGRILSRAECVAIDQLLEQQEITGGALWYDYQMPRTERLTLAFAHAAVGQAQAGHDGAALANYVEAVEVLRDAAGQLTGARLRDGISGETFNIGPDEEFVTIKQLAGTIADLLHFELTPTYVKGRPQEVRLANCSAAKIRRYFGYNTRYSLRDGLAEMIDWIRMRGVKPFKYHLDLEIVNELTPRTWKERMF